MQVYVQLRGLVDFDVEIKKLKKQVGVMFLSCGCDVQEDAVYLDYCPGAISIFGL